MSFVVKRSLRNFLPRACVGLNMVAVWSEGRLGASSLLVVGFSAANTTWSFYDFDDGNS